MAGPAVPRARTVDLESTERPVAIILLRGLGRESAHWRPFDTILRDETRCEVHTLDNPGFGTEKELAAPLSIAKNTEDLRSRWLKIPDVHDRRWCVVGHSMGGMIALDWAKRYQKDLAYLVLMNSSCAQTSPPWDRIRPKAFWAFSLAPCLPALERERRLLPLVTSMPERKEATLKLWLEIAAERPTSVCATINQMIAASRFSSSKKLAAAHPSLLVLAGRGDRLANPFCSERLAKKFGGRLEMHASAGHDIAADDPHWTAGVIRDWLQQQQQRGEPRAEVISTATTPAR